MYRDDHIRMGKDLCQKYLNDVSYAGRFLFRLGNIVPDYLPPTYLKGITRDKKPLGHNYDNCRISVKLRINWLNFKKHWGLFSYFALGVLMHYTADSFTYPHNNFFDGSLHDHAVYEQVLHQKLWKRNAVPVITTEMARTAKEDLFSFFERQHEEYAANRKEMSDDIAYIKRNCFLLMDLLCADHGHMPVRSLIMEW